MGERREHTDLRGGIRVYGRSKISRESPFLLSSGSSSRISIEIESISVKSWFFPRFEARSANYKLWIFHLKKWFKYFMTCFWYLFTIVRKKYVNNCNLIFIQDEINKNNKIDYKINERNKFLENFLLKFHIGIRWYHSKIILHKIKKSRDELNFSKQISDISFLSIKILSICIMKYCKRS